MTIRIDRITQIGSGTSVRPVRVPSLDTALNLSADWILGANWSQGSGSLQATAADPATEIAKNIAGVFENHLYRLTFNVVAINRDIEIRFGGTLAPNDLNSTGITVYTLRPIAGNFLSLRVAAGSPATIEIDSILVEALDPFNPDILPQS